MVVGVDVVWVLGVQADPFFKITFAGNQVYESAVIKKGGDSGGRGSDPGDGQD